MNPHRISFALASVLLFASGIFTGCESTDGGGTHVTSNNYYGVGFNDPWYHGDYDDDRNIIIVPPRPDNTPENGLHPAHPIAGAPQVSRPSPQPMPSIPSTPRPAQRPATRR